MSETSNTELIAERLRQYAERQWADFKSAPAKMLEEAATALESLTATLTETKADLQTSRGREEALQAENARLEAAKADAWDEGWRRGNNYAIDTPTQGADGKWANPYRSIPSPTLEAVKAADVTAGTVVRSAEGTIACRFDQTLGVVFGDDRPFAWSLLADPIEVLWLPVETEGESRG